MLDVFISAVEQLTKLSPNIFKLSLDSHYLKLKLQFLIETVVLYNFHAIKKWYQISTCLTAQGGTLKEFKQRDYK